MFTSDEPGDPNGDSLLEYWLGLCDYYNFPHVVQFDSWPDLLDKLRRTDLAAVSQKMSRFNAEQKLQLKDTWRTILADARARRSHVATHAPASESYHPPPPQIRQKLEALEVPVEPLDVPVAVEA